MNARTIQHPGVEMRQIDMSEYRDAIMVNNAYIIGFADKGPVYDYSWITTQSQFIKLYGKPQTEAEKYLYYAVTSVLNNGGTPVVARMPYDNKQCKAYKGLAIRYSGITDDNEQLTKDQAAKKSIDNVKIYGWKAKPQASEDYYPDYMGEDGVESKLGINAIPLSADAVINLDKLSSVIGFEEDPITTTNKVATYLTKKGQLVPDKTVDDILSAFMGYEADNSVYVNTYKDVIALINAIDPADVNTYAVDGYKAPDATNKGNEISSKLVDIKNKIDACTSEETSPIKQELSAYFNSSYKISSVVYYYEVLSNDLELPVITGNSVPTGYYCKTEGTGANLKVTDYYGTTNVGGNATEITTTTLTAVLAYLQPTLSKKFGLITGFVNLSADASYTPIVSGINDFTAMTGYSSLATGSKLYISDVTDDNRQYISAMLTATNGGWNLNDVKVLDNSSASALIRKDVINRYLSLRDYVSLKKFETEVFNDYKYNGVSISAINIPLTAIQDFKKNLSTETTTTGSGENAVTTTTTILTTPIKDLSSLLSSSTFSGDALTFARMFNSPVFYDTDSLYDEEGYHEATQALIDSKVIAKSNLGYKNIVMLDSKDVVISNDQYDDLVTAQRFTDGDNIENPDAKSDINHRFRTDIRSANFIIIDKHKSIADGEGSNEGIFVTIIDPYDGLKAQRLLYHNYTDEELTNKFDPKKIEYYIKANEIDWRQRVIDEIETMNGLQHVYNADELIVGEQKETARFRNLMDTWSVPLTGGFYDDSISKNLARLYKQIPMGDIKPGQKLQDSTIEKAYSSYVTVAVCRTLVDPSNGRITVSVIESFFGSLFDEKDIKTGESKFIGNIINENSDYIEFYRNDFVKNPYSDDPFEVRVPQMYMRNSQELKQAADTAGIDLSLYDTNDVYKNLIESDQFTSDLEGNYHFSWEEFADLYKKIVLGNSDSLRYAKYDFLYFGERLAQLAGEKTFNVDKTEGTGANAVSFYKKYYEDYFEKAETYKFNSQKLTIVPSDFTENFDLYSYSKLVKDLNHKASIFIFDKTDTLVYNNHPVGHFSSFSRKDSQKVIANTTGLTNDRATRHSVADNFLVDMDRCIKFINNVDEVNIYFVVDAGISTIAQYCDNIVWDYFKKEKAFEPVKGGWITQGYDPEHDPDAEDRIINNLEDISTWRAVVDKLNEISQEIRKDCMTIIDAPRQLTLEGAAPKIRRSKPENDWKNVVGDKLRWIAGINSSYTAGYYNWLRVTDTFTGKAFWLPPTCKVIGNYMYLTVQNLPWLAPAGATYGVVTGVHGVSHNPGYKEEDEIYLKSWNYIKQYAYEGFIIEGQKTTLTKDSAFNRVNVRTLFLDLERYVYSMSRNFKYTVNNQYTRQQYVQTLATKFNDYKSRGGLADYKIICDEKNNTPEVIDNLEIRASIYIKPTKLSEFVLVDFICTKSSTNFEEII